MFGEVLHNIIHRDKSMTSDDVALAWGLEVKSIYYYMSNWPGTDKFLQLLRVAPAPAQRELLSLITRHAPSWYVHHVDAKLDVNGNGDINIDDLLASAVAKIGDASLTLNRTYEALADGELSNDEAAELERVADAALAGIVQYRQILKYLRDHKLITRRKLTPPGSTPGSSKGGAR